MVATHFENPGKLAERISRAVTLDDPRTADVTPSDEGKEACAAHESLSRTMEQICESAGQLRRLIKELHDDRAQSHSIHEQLLGQTETARACARDARHAAERSLEAAEQAQIASEKTRQIAERARDAAEQMRLAAESMKVVAEARR